MTRDLNRDWALRYAETGISVFPCAADKKVPLIKWRAGSTIDARSIATWWHRWPGALVGIDLHKCGLLVLDADRHAGGADGVAALATLLRKHQTSTSTIPITHTPGDGFHLYFRQPAEPLGNREGNLPEGINVRGSGGLTIAPHCIRPDGKHYRSLAGHPDLITAFKTGTIPVLPHWLVEIIRPRPAPMPPIKISRADGRREHAYACAALTRAAQQLAAKPAESGRNQELNLTAWKMATMAARGWIDPGEVANVLFQAATACRLVADTGARAVQATISSGINAGLARPHPDLKDRPL
jgi:hypothetical protein